MIDVVFDPRLFRYAFASAECGSFRRAAAALNIQQSTVSRGVKKLEHHVGVALFERGHAGVRPTTAGHRFLEEATLGFAHLSRALRHAEALKRNEHGQLTISASVPFSVLGEMLGRLREAHAGISLEFIESTTSGGWQLVRQRTVDIAVVSKPRVDEGFRSLHLRDERMNIVLPKSHPLAGARKLTLEELQLERFILCAGGLGPDIEEHLVRRMAKWGVEPRVQLHRVGQCNMINMVAMGFGVTIVVGPVSGAATDGVVLVPLTGRNVVSLCAVWMESNPNPALKGLLNIARGSGQPAAAP